MHDFSRLTTSESRRPQQGVATTEPPSTGPHVLVVDDHEQVRRFHERALGLNGFQIETAADGNAAMQAVRGGSFDVILSDIDMPGMNGIRLLECVRAYDLDVPVVLITGSPSVETAVQALERGALRYLTKPVAIEELVTVLSDAARLHRLAKAKRQALSLADSGGRFGGDHAGLGASLGRALSSLHVAYQPIVSWSMKGVYAYEALLRSREPNLPNPAAVLDAAERLGRLHELGRKIREMAIEPSGRLAGNIGLFLNVHPNDLLDDQLLAKDGPLADIAQRVVLEVTERASLDQLPDVRGRVAALRKIGFRIALDDLGAGYGGLTSFSLLEPDIVKLDLGLVRNLDREPTKQTIVRTMIGMCHELGMIVTAEGVETLDERDELIRMGCDLLQGYLFAKPGKAFPAPEY